MAYGYGNHVFFTAFFVVWVVVVGFTLLVAVAVYVLSGLAFMKLFRKVGVEPWAAWVPYFNIWRILELGGQPGWFALFSLIPYGGIVTIVFECIGAHKTGIAFRKDGTWVVLFYFFPFIWAWLLAADGLPYEPERITQRGYKPPLVGYGSARGPYQPQNPTTAPTA